MRTPLQGASTRRCVRAIAALVPSARPRSPGVAGWRRSRRRDRAQRIAGERTAAMRSPVATAAKAAPDRRQLAARAATLTQLQPSAAIAGSPAPAAVRTAASARIQDVSRAAAQSSGSPRNAQHEPLRGQLSTTAASSAAIAHGSSEPSSSGAANTSATPARSRRAWIATEQRRMTRCNAFTSHVTSPCGGGPRQPLRPRCRPARSTPARAMVGTDPPTARSLTPCGIGSGCFTVCESAGRGLRTTWSTARNEV